MKVRLVVQPLDRATNIVTKGDVAVVPCRSQRVADAVPMDARTPAPAPAPEVELVYGVLVHVVVRVGRSAAHGVGLEESQPADAKLAVPGRSAEDLVTCVGLLASLPPRVRIPGFARIRAHLLRVAVVPGAKVPQ